MRWAGATWAALILGVCFWTSATSVVGWGEPAVEAGAAVLIDQSSGAVLFQKAMRERRPMASITKIMTALVALESAGLDDWVTVSHNATEVQPSSLAFQPGDQMRMEDLLAGLLLRSANDAAVAIAEHVSGSVEAFSARMNQRAQELGAADTRFANPHGLHAPDHYSSAYDLALITREAMQHPTFRRLVGAKLAEIHRPGNGGKETILNHNKLLWRADFVDGVKTGYVRQSGQCLAASGTKENWQLIAVLLDSPDIYGEALTLLDYGFSNYRQRIYAPAGGMLGRAAVRHGRQRWVPAVCSETLSALTGPGLGDEGSLEVSFAPLKAPVARGDQVGEARLLVAGTVVARSALIAGEPVPRSRLVVAAVWTARALVVLVLVALLIRTNAKLVKAYRHRRRGLAPQSGRAYPRRPGEG